MFGLSVCFFSYSRPTNMFSFFYPVIDHFKLEPAVPSHGAVLVCINLSFLFGYVFCLLVFVACLLLSMFDGL